jgi:frataxin
MDDFHQSAALILEEMADYFESSWPEADVDLLEDSLAVHLHDGKQYLLNKHGVTQQIWLSSPYSGAHHFALKNGHWHCTRTDKRLEDLLHQERKSYVS